MARGPLISTEERAAIVAAANAGESLNGIAAALGRDDSGIAGVVSRAGLDIRLAQSRRFDAYRDFSRMRRLELGNRLADAVDEILDRGPISAGDLRNLAVVYSILTERRRLEDGLSTENKAISVRVWSRKRPNMGQP